MTSLRKIKKENILLFGNWTALRLSLAISILMFFIMLIGVAYARAGELGAKHGILNLFSLISLFSFLINVLTLFILFQFQFWVIKKYKDGRQKGMMLKIFLGSFILIFVLSFLFAQIHWYIFPMGKITLRLFLLIYFIRNVIMLIVSLLITIILLLLDKRHQVMIENQKLSMENLQNRYEALKNQVDPHFLFNSLNTLNGLIGYDDDKAHDYVDQLSSVFRYTIQNKKVIHLQDELDFIESYIYLMKIRYNESLQLAFQTDTKYLNYYILPFGLQLLIENCIKHNVISNKYPLLITIETTENETIIVKNTIRLKPDTISLGIGLANLNERYQLIFNKEIKISEDETFFTVEIPLIKDIEKYNNKLNNIL